MQSLLAIILSVGLGMAVFNRRTPSKPTTMAESTATGTEVILLGTGTRIPTLWLQDRQPRSLSVAAYFCLTRVRE
jgi:hypothetical protein